MGIYEYDSHLNRPYYYELMLHLRGVIEARDEADAAEWVRRDYLRVADEVGDTVLSLDFIEVRLDA